MRRVVVSALAGLVGILLAGGAASAADPSPTPAASDAPTYKAGEPVCTITDAKLIGLSGLIATDTGFVTITDSYTDKSAIKIWFLDQSCKLQKSVSYPTAPFDPEDMAMGKDGTIWVADIGDNYGERQPPAGRGIALWKLPPNSTTPQIFRYSYPDSAHDAETLLLAADDSPIFVTKNSQGSKVYVPTAPPDPSGKAVPLKEVGSFTPQHTGTPNSLSVVGNTFVTGGANSPDRKRVAIRTYSDAYEWDVPDGDVVKAITTGTPRITPLPNETNGEGIAYSPDGKLFYTIEDIEIPPIRTPILKYTPKAAPVGGPKAPATGAKSGGGGIPLSLSQITYLVAGVGVFGLLLLAGGVFGIMRSRKNRKRRDDDWDDDYDNGEWDDDRGGRQPARSGSYGRGRGASGHGPNGAPRDYGAGGAPRDYGAGGAPRDYGTGGGYGGFPPGPGGFPPPAPTYGTAAPAGGAVYGGRGGGGAGGTVYGGGGGQGAYQEPYPQGYQQPGYDQGYYDQGYYDQGYQDPGYQDPAYQDPGYHGNGYADQGYYSDQQPDGYQDRRR